MARAAEVQPVVVRQVAIINESEHVSPEEFANTCAALQIQVQRDFGPVWAIESEVVAFDSLDAISADYWPVVIRDDIGINTPAIHLSDGRKHTFALVLFTGDDWARSLSQTVLNMLANPFGKTFLYGPSIRRKRGMVRYLADVADPCQAEDGGYAIEGVSVSDFVFPNYYTAHEPGKYSHTGRMDEPRSVQAFGCLTWNEPFSGAWWQRFHTPNGPRTKEITVDVRLANIHLRSQIARAMEKMTPIGRKRKTVAAERKIVHQLLRKYAHTTAAMTEWWQRELQKVAARAAGRPQLAEAMTS